MYGLANQSSTGGLGRVARSACYVVGAALLSTGAVAMTSSTERLQSYFKGREHPSAIVSPHGSSQVSRIDVRSAQQHLENIKSVFALPISDLAQALGVTRQSIYKWMSASAIPEGDNLSRLASLSRIADRFSNARIERAGALLSVKVSGEKSVLELFRSGESVDEYIPQLVAEATAIDHAYESSAVHNRAATGSSEWRSSISIPPASEA